VTRERLPNRRRCETFDFEHGQFLYTATLGFYDDGRLGEVFLSGAKSGTEIQIAAIEGAIALSFALQHGCAPQTIRPAVPRNENGSAQGLLGTLLDMLGDWPDAPVPSPSPSPKAPAAAQVST
jgi:ribonucleoside-diphosphate reductase alpha chain